MGVYYMKFKAFCGGVQFCLGLKGKVANGLGGMVLYPGVYVFFKIII